MQLLEQFYNLLKDIDGSFFSLQAPQNKKMPYSVYKVISEPTTNCLDCEDELKTIKIQISSFCNSLDTARSIISQIRVKLNENEDFSCIILQSFEDVEDSGAVFKAVLDLEIIEI